MRSWHGDKGQGPTIDECFLDRRSSLIPMVIVLSKAQQIYFDISFNYVQINIIPYLDMGLQTLKRWGMISHGIGWEVSQPLSLRER